MNLRENVLAVYNHRKPETTPVLLESVQLVGLWAANECGLRGEEVRPGVNLDSFGCEWDQTHGQPVPYPGNYVLDDICNWRETVVFPDIENWDWDALAAAELGQAGYNRDEKALTFFSEMGCFDRLSTVMGFQNMLIAMAMEPDACSDFFGAVADYKIKLIDIVYDAYHPDIFNHNEDIAKADGLMISPDMYRKLIKPHHARIIKAIRDRGMIAEQHTCGKCDAVAGDYAEIGIQSFFPAQASNDNAEIIRRYGDTMIVTGGFDSQGAVGRGDATEDITRAEARRMADDYAALGNYVCMPMIGTALSADEGEMQRIGWFLDEFHRECARLGI